MPLQPTESSESFSAARSLHERLAGSTLPAQLARLYSLRTRVKSGKPLFATWSASESEARLREAFQLIDAALVERSGGFDGWESALRRAAEILEWLSDAQPDGDRRINLLAAAAYQIAGYPARSRGIIEASPEGSVLRHFLGANFPALHQELPHLWNALDSDMPLNESDLLDRALSMEVSRALGIISASIRWGDDGRLESALEKLKDASAVMLHGGDTIEWLFTKLCGVVAQSYANADLRAQTKLLAETLTPTGQAVLERYTRQAYLSNRSLVWPSQTAGVHSILNMRNFALCTPTGSGKTSVAELAILQALFNRTAETSIDEPIALYMVSTRSLATEVEKRLSRTVRRLSTETPITVTGLYGGTDWGPSDAWLTNRGPVVLICTYEKAEALLRFIGPLFARRVKLVVIDEAHSVNLNVARAEASWEGNRPLRLESLLMRLLARLNDGNVRFIALSAVAQGSEEDIASWVSGTREDRPVKVAYRSMRQMVGRLLCGPEYRIEYDLLDGTDLRLTARGGTEDRPYIPAPFPSCPVVPTVNSDTNDALVRPYMFWAALQMAAPDRNGRRGTVLISVAERPGGYAESLLKLLDVTWKRLEIPKFFEEPTDPEDLDLWQNCLASCADYFGKESQEYRLLERGIVVHHGKMPGLMARFLVQVIEAGMVHLVIATSTLTEGVNLPFDTILIPRLDRLSGDMAPQEFANLVGRAGRPGKAVEGRGLVVLYNNPAASSTVRRKVKETVARYEKILASLSQADADPGTNPKSPLAELLVYVRDCWQELQPQGSREEFISWLETAAIPEEVDANKALSALDALDGVLLPSVVEAESRIELDATGALSTLEEELNRFWRRSYAFFASSRQEQLRQIFTTRGCALHDRILQDHDERRRLYQTSLTPRNGRLLLKAFPTLRTVLESGREYGALSPRDRLAFVEEVATGIFDIPTFAPKPTPKTIKGGWKAVLAWWLAPALASEKPTPAKISAWQDFASQNFAYRLAWGVGSVLALIADEEHKGELRETSLAEWEQIGLPWSAMWLKEIITWGTLEPVATHLLSKRHVNTRQHAESEALRYYAEWSELSQEDPNAILHPNRIREWAELEFSGFEIERQQSRTRYPVKLCRDFSSQTKRRWYVLPSPDNGTVRWFDPAGYLLAESHVEHTPAMVFPVEQDYVLDADQATVYREQYY